jgi:response regulator RpfG family c-di-GMP phosphodiesterase
MSVHFLLITSIPAEKRRISDVADEFQFKMECIESVDSLLTLGDRFDGVRFVLLSAHSDILPQDIAGNVQVIRQTCKDAFICILAGRKMNTDALNFIRRSGASLVILEDELFESSKIEFMASQVIRASYIPVKLNEFRPGQTLTFSLWHLLPLNQKMLPVIAKGTILDAARLDRFGSINELFIKREEVAAYQKFTENNVDNSAHGLLARCRAKYLSLCAGHTQLVFMLTDQSEQASFEEGKWLFERCQLLAKDLLTSLASIADAWDVVNNSSLGDFGSIERSPTIASYAGITSLLSSIGEPVEVMVGAMLADIGMLQLSPSVTKKLRLTGNLKSLHAEELVEYRKHPIFSLNRCLERKLQLPEAIKSMILNSHERVDGTGFPYRPNKEKIPPQAMLLQFCEKIDQAAMVKMGQERKSPAAVRKAVLAEQLNNADIFALTFLNKVKAVI